MDEPKRSYKSLTKRIHRIFGLWGLVWVVALCASGIALNHPAALSSFDLPRSWLPGDYEYRDWNRASFRGTERLPRGGTVVYGEAGIWLADGWGATPRDWSQGLTLNAWGKDTRAVLAEEGKNLVYAATREGLYVREATEDAPPWRALSLPGNDEAVTDLFIARGYLFALTRSALYRAETGDPTAFTRVKLGRIAEPYRNPSLFRLVFDMHKGAVWGLPGTLAVDFVGFAAIFLALTGGFFWLKKKRRELVSTTSGKAARKGLKYHIKAGLLLSPFLIFVTLTGIFQRPPLLIAIAYLDYPPWLHPAPADQNPWKDKLRKALYDPVIERVVVSTSEGVHEADFSAVESGHADLVRVYRNPPISVMGATVFKKEARDGGGYRYLVGSMSGLFVWDRESGGTRDAFTGLPPTDLGGPPVGAQMVMGIADEGGNLLWADYSLGLMDTAGNKAAWPMPPELAQGGEISLWHALFELHNGRLFEALLGWWYWIVVPLGGMLFLIIVATGAYDRLVRKKARG